MDESEEGKADTRRGGGNPGFCQQTAHPEVCDNRRVNGNVPRNSASQISLPADAGIDLSL